MQLKFLNCMSKKKKKKKGGGSIDKKALKKSILAIFGANPNQPRNYKQLSNLLLIKDTNERKLVNDVLNEMAEEGELDEVSRGKFKMRSQTGYIIGRVEMTNAGYGFIRSENFDEDIFVSHKNLNHALNDDLVRVYLYAKRKKLHYEGEVVEIIERSRNTIVGVLEISGRVAFVVPDRSTPYDLFIPMDKLNGAQDNQKVVSRITDWPRKAKNPVGEVLEVLGDVGENETEMHAILAEFELPYKFPDEVIEAAEKIPEAITKDDYVSRKDFRKVTTFTIDPADAKDFDDALSLQKLPDGLYEVGVHIADVTHYVKNGSILDQEALDRATSVYLVDRVVPMLPERLSNQICSLRPNEEKLCFSAVFKMNEDAEVVDEWFGRTVIYSNRRFSYEEAQTILDEGKGDMVEELDILDDLAQKLRKERFKKGSIDFERDEVKFEIDEKGKPVRVFFKKQGNTNELIEEFMLLANKQVASFIGKVPEGNKAKSFVYRIHDKPNMEKLENFSRFIHKFGYSINLSSSKKIQKSLNELLHGVKGKKEQDLIENLALRAMAKAEYSTKNIGHYGLSFKYYTHFTSPIRRYPDMMVHELLGHYLQGGSSKSAKKYESHCHHSSEMERKAVEAERASIKYKQVEFMMDHIGQIFDGIITGVTNWGIYVEIIENKCEGMIPMRELTDDFYELDEENYCIVGRRSDKVFQLGDQVKIEVARANLLKKQLDFTLVD